MGSVDGPRDYNDEIGNILAMPSAMISNMAHVHAMLSKTGMYIYRSTRVLNACQILNAMGVLLERQHGVRRERRTQVCVL